MRIRLKTAFAGSRFSYPPGSVVEWPDDADAERMIKGGGAERVGPPTVETATAPPAAERATLDKAPKNGNGKNGHPGKNGNGERRVDPVDE